MVDGGVALATPVGVRLIIIMYMAQYNTRTCVCTRMRHTPTRACEEEGLLGEEQTSVACFRFKPTLTINMIIW